MSRIGSLPIPQPFTSTLARFAGGLVEATWLTAVACVPLLANRHSIRSFEPDKLALLRTLALIALGAWLLKVLGESGTRPERLDPPPHRAQTRVWILVATVGLSIAYLVSTLASLSPHVSFWGSYARWQGTYTLLSYVALFAVVVANLRDQSQADRLVGTIIAASLPVAAYGIAQRFGLDPVATNRGLYLGTSRVTSTLGNPVFLGAYLAMVWPLTMARALEGVARSRGNGDRSLAAGIGTVLLIVTAGAQLTAVVLSESRGPFLGLAVSAVGLLLIVATLRGARRLILGAMAGALAGVALLALVIVAGGPVRAVGKVLLISRLAEIFAPTRGSGSYRLETWGLAPRLLAAHEPFRYPDGHVDSWHRLRFLIGYGPETLPVLIRSVSRNPAPTSPDRFHNAVWDTAVTTGVVGLAAVSVLILGLLYAAMRRLRLVSGRRLSALFWICTIGGAAAGGLLSFSWFGSAASAAGVQLGLVGGQLAYLGLRGVAEPKPAAASRLDRNDLLICAVWAALIGHIVELSFSFLVAATGLLFWVYAALLQRRDAAGAEEPLSINPGPSRAAPSRPSRRHRRPSARDLRVTSPGRWQPALEGGAILTIIMITIGFLILDTVKASSAVEVLGNALMTARPGSWPPVVLALGLLVTWTGTAGILIISTPLAGSPSAPAKLWGRVLLVSGVLTAAYWLWLSADLAALSQQRLVDASSGLAKAEGYARIVIIYYCCLLALTAGFAAARSAEHLVRVRQRTAPDAIAVSLLIGVTLAIAWFVALRPIQADTVFYVAFDLHRARVWEGAAVAYRRAIELAPDIARYRADLARLYFDQSEQSERAANPERREAFLRQAERTYQDLQVVDPLSNWSYAPLATLYATWAFQTSDPKRRLELGRRAAAQYERAVSLGPNDPTLWFDSAYLDMALLNRPAEARTKALRALDLDPGYEPALALLANQEVERWRARPGTEEGRQALRLAATYYERAARVAKDKYQYLRALAEVRGQLGDVEHAIKAYVSARPIASATEVWKVDEALARLYAMTGATDLALRHATLALESAPLDARARLEVLRTDVRRGK
ncbi:MAG TPA: hypothetical protein VMS64_17165 [Candidatus Methylomirabilis sp.]|nr:hypothetical protein [Candidatus Methylomirabilis sp.]